jgi:hypothetical protein
MRRTTKGNIIFMSKHLWIIVFVLLTACVPTRVNQSLKSSTQAQSVASISSALMKAKCLEMGQENPDFHERRTNEDWIHYDFFYSSVLDTCVVEKMVDRLVNDDVGSWYVLFDMLAPEGSGREIISYYSWCLDGKNPSDPELECKTWEQYQAEKKRIFPDYSLEI